MSWRQFVLLTLIGWMIGAVIASSAHGAAPFGTVSQSQGSIANGLCKAFLSEAPKGTKILRHFSAIGPNTANGQSYWCEAEIVYEGRTEVYLFNALSDGEIIGQGRVNRWHWLPPTDARASGLAA